MTAVINSYQGLINADLTNINPLFANKEFQKLLTVNIDNNSSNISYVYSQKQTIIDTIPLGLVLKGDNALGDSFIISNVSSKEITQIPIDVGGSQTIPIVKINFTTNSATKPAYVIPLELNAPAFIQPMSTPMPPIPEPPIAEQSKGQQLRTEIINEMSILFRSYVSFFEQNIDILTNPIDAQALADRIINYNPTVNPLKAELNTTNLIQKITELKNMNYATYHISRLTRDNGYLKYREAIKAFAIRFDGKPLNTLFTDDNAGIGTNIQKIISLNYVLPGSEFLGRFGRYAAIPFAAPARAVANLGQTVATNARGLFNFGAKRMGIEPEKEKQDYPYALIYDKYKPMTDDKERATFINNYDTMDKTQDFRKTNIKALLYILGTYIMTAKKGFLKGNIKKYIKPLLNTTVINNGSIDSMEFDPDYNSIQNLLEYTKYMYKMVLYIIFKLNTVVLKTNGIEPNNGLLYNNSNEINTFMDFNFNPSLDQKYYNSKTVQPFNISQNDIFVKTYINKILDTIAPLTQYFQGGSIKLHQKRFKLHEDNDLKRYILLDKKKVYVKETKKGLYIHLDGKRVYVK